MKKIKRTVIVKTDTKDFVKYEYVNDLVRFTAFLNRTFPNWRFMNVFDRASREQIASFTKKNPPSAHI
jgi:hypothetical protein